MNGFDLLAPMYDMLAKLIFRDCIFKASTAYLHLIKPGDKVLIIGGGTGKVLEEIKARDIEVTYVELSGAMLKRAEDRDLAYKITFIQGSYYDIPDLKFDVVITAFFLDMFVTEKAIEILELLAKKLHKNGVWLFTDFVKSERAVHGLLLSTMYFSFRLLCKIEAKTLPDYGLIFKNFKAVSEEEYFDGMIKSVVFKLGITNR